MDVYTGPTYTLSFNYGQNASLKSGNSVDLRVSLKSNAGAGPIDFAQTELRLDDESFVPLGSVAAHYTVGGAVVDNFSVVNVATVPEPDSYALVAAGLAMVAGLSRAKRRRSA